MTSRASGTFLERADNTARILDVKYYVLLPSAAVGGHVDRQRAVGKRSCNPLSARGGYRMQFGNAINPRDIAHFLILDKRMPRSLAFSVGKLRDNLRYLQRGMPAPPPSLGQVNHLESKYLAHDIQAIFAFGLHEFIQEILGRLAGIAQQIEIDFRFYE